MIETDGDRGPGRSVQAAQYDDDDDDDDDDVHYTFLNTFVKLKKNV